MCTMRPSPTTTSSVPVLIAVSRASTAARRSAVRAVRISGLLALEISCGFMASGSLGTGVFVKWSWFLASFDLAFQRGQLGLIGGIGRSEEHTSELQSLMRISYAVFCLKKTRKL